jgi:LDH2 family malate/lactate/ureidoglycolate dehydrogenase
VRLPGEHGLQRYRDQQANGVALFDGILPALSPWAAKFSVTLPVPVA